MKILILRSFYPKHLRKLEEEILSSEYSEEKIRKRINKEDLYLQKAVSVYLAKNFDVVDIIENSTAIQRKWERDRFPACSPTLSKLLRKVRMEPISKIGFFTSEEFYRILAKQIIFYKPDIIITFSSAFINPEFFSDMKKIHSFKLVGYHGAAPFNIKIKLACYDFFFSPFLPTVIKVKNMGVKTELVHHGFSQEIIDILKSHNSEGGDDKKLDIVFSGSLHMVHRSRLHLLEEIARTFKDRFFLFTQSYNSLTPVLKKVYRGEIFGIEQLKVLSKAKIVINHHGDILPWAHNMRLFEATGVGSLLITDKLPNLENLFDIGREVIAYSDVNECISFIERYLQDEEIRERISKAGQRKTLKDHTYEKRINEIKVFLQKYGIL